MHAFVMVCSARLLYSQSGGRNGLDPDAVAPFEVYGLASAMTTVDATANVVITTPPPNQPVATPSGAASGFRTGVIWRQENLGLVTDVGFHRYSDRAGSTSVAPLMAGFRIYSNEAFRTAFYGEFLAAEPIGGPCAAPT